MHLNVKNTKLRLDTVLYKSTQTGTWEIAVKDLSPASIVSPAKAELWKGVELVG